MSDPSAAEGETYSEEDLKLVVDIWKKIVDVQQHFNDLELRIRNLYITIIAALVAFYGVALQKDFRYVEIGTWKIASFLFVLLAITLFGNAFHFMDRHWYHRLLVGAVKHGISIENKFKQRLPELSLSASIGAESPIAMRNGIRLWLNRLFISDPQSRKGQKIHSAGKIDLFYNRITNISLVVTVLSAFFGGLDIGNASLAQIAAHWLNTLVGR